MNRFKLHLGLILSILVIPTLSFATTLTGLGATPSNDENWLTIAWTAADSETLSQMDGYAIQWSDSQSDIHIQKPTRIYTNTNSQTVRLRTFDRGTDYFFRVYTYTRDGRTYTLDNGSKILKWRLVSGNKVETSEITITDPVIAVNTSNNDNNNTTSSFEFGALRVLALDTFADLSWSTPSKMARSEYSGFYITLSKNANMDSPIKTFKADRTKNKARIKGLTPNTQYYARGAFYKDINGRNSVFGESAIKAFTTIEAIDRSISSRKSRNLAKIERKSYFTVTVGETEVTPTTTTTSANSTTKTTKSNNTSLLTRIANLKQKIADLQRDLRLLESQVSGEKKTTKPTTRSTTKRKSLRDRLRERLAKKRR